MSRSAIALLVVIAVALMVALLSPKHPPVTGTAPPPASVDELKRVRGMWHGQSSHGPVEVLFLAARIFCHSRDYQSSETAALKSLVVHGDTVQFQVLRLLPSYGSGHSPTWFQPDRVYTGKLSANDKRLEIGDMILTR